MTTLLVLVSCTGSLNQDDYLRYMANPENGLVKQKETNGIQMRLKHLPTDYLASREAQESEDISLPWDSLRSSYANSLTFILTLGPDEDKRFDITRVGVSSYEEFMERIETMHFGLQQHISLQIGETTYAPALVQMEPIYGLSTKRDILVVFEMEQWRQSLKGDKVQFTWDDHLFHTGKNHFTFYLNDLRSVPELNFIG